MFMPTQEHWTQSQRITDHQNLSADMFSLAYMSRFPVMTYEVYADLGTNNYSGGNWVNDMLLF